jgi:hypothetical protein
MMMAMMRRRERRATASAARPLVEPVLALVTVNLAALLEAAASAFCFLGHIGASPGIDQTAAVLLMVSVTMSHGFLLKP